MMPQDYINTGILEAYVTGAASEEEVNELMHMKAKYAEVNEALEQLELDMEHIAQQMAITPPADTWKRISYHIDELILRPEDRPEEYNADTNNRGPRDFKTDHTGPNYIEVEAESSQMKIHKAWKWVFAAVFILGKIFLGCAIYFYLANRQSQQQIQDLKTELRQLKK